MYSAVQKSETSGGKRDLQAEAVRKIETLLEETDDITDFDEEDRAKMLKNRKMDAFYAYHSILMNEKLTEYPVSEVVTIKKSLDFDAT